MSYDMAVWEGERPPGDVEAGEVFAEHGLVCFDVQWDGMRP
ncbi:hypothetical protein [Catenulispora pinisilvae]|nr:hypothetical protein [Catenulispora pinisilvae]